MMMCSKAFAFVAVGIFFLISVKNGINCQSTESGKGKDPKSNCDGTVAILNNPSGQLEYNTTLHDLTNKTCIWTINYNKSNYTIYFWIQEMVLDDNDSLTIRDSKNATLYELKGKQMPGFLVTGVHENVTIILSTTQSKNARKFDVNFAYNNAEADVSNIDGDGKLRVRYDVKGKTGALPKAGFGIHMTVSPNVIGNYLIATHIINANLIANSDYGYSYDKEPETPFKPDTPDLISAGMHLVFHFDQSSPGQEVLFMYELVDKECSGIIEDKEIFFLPTTIRGKDNLNCITIGQRSGDIAFDLNLNASDYSMDNTDLLTIRDGNRNNATVMSEINPSSLTRIANDVRITNSNKIYIQFRSHVSFANRNVQLLYYASSNTRHLQGPGNQIVKVDPADSTKPVFIYTTDNGNQAVLATKDIKVGDGYSINIYGDTSKNSPPLAMFTANQLMPKILVSNTNVLRVEISSSKQAFEGNFSTQSFTCNQIGASQTFSLTTDKVACNLTCQFIIPSTKAGALTSIQLPFLSLKDKTSCVTLTEYKDQPKQVLKICGNDDKSFSSASLPSIIGISDYTYVLEYTRGICSPPGPNITLPTESLIQATYSLLEPNQLKRNISVQLGKTLSLKPVTYPNNYTINMNDINSQQYGWNINAPMIYTVFNDVDLAPNHNITLNSASGNFSVLNNLDLPADSIVVNRSYLVFSTPIISNNISTSEMISGRGFKISLEAFDCGAHINNGDKTTSIQTPGFPGPLKNVTKCIYIVEVPLIDKLPTFINFTIDYGKDGENGELQIYDSSTVRDNMLVNLTEKVPGSDRLSSSKNTMIVMYTVKDPAKGGKALNISWTSQKCNTSVCHNDPTRCILPQWLCNGINNCGDNSDELFCNATAPIVPTPIPGPTIVSGGVSGWVIVFVIIPLSMIVGAILALFGPKILRSLRGGQYQEFRDFSEVS